MADCDILVVGGGPAGALTALLSARAGHDVILVKQRGAAAARPTEVMPPWCLHHLASHGLALPEGALACRGLLSAWEDETPHFHDYELLGGGAGAAFTPAQIEAQLHAQIARSPVRQSEGHVSWSDDGPTAVELQLGRLQTWNISARFVVWAAGRSSRTGGMSQRRHYDKLVALTFPFATKRPTDCLVVEATAEGWWYVPPASTSTAQLVFLSDADLLPAGGAARSCFFRRIFGESPLVNELAAEAPVFVESAGCDARFSASRPFTGMHRLSLGDAAVSLDPLSGSGLTNALAAAAELVSHLDSAAGLAPKAACAAMEAWYNALLERETAIRHQTYLRAAHRFPGARFWLRRVPR
ncbi:NAD(P)/FAD-dependent oxidoreductase [Pseudoduganella chitinolytica]|uniref:FAD-dependent monooxygenase n=1 Tax=Pseudoduganella chitinolytica TaxID=34070 RepID=A0ABY8BEA0_9BURK|nr:FAD-dependent monooxygenase [Pseudoduganella chitinolytica]WEF34232.1 FAD-dependent monooxygenase [Pseudoduganella chitinolytica]